MLEKNIPLNPREIEVASFVWKDLTDKEIAHEMGISQHTVNAHVRAIRTKLGVRGRAGVALWYERFSAG